MSQKEKDIYPFSQRKPDDSSIAILQDWWRRLEDNKGERAVLKRANSLTEIIFNPAFHRLLRTLRNKGFIISESRLPKLAAIVGLAAHIKRDIVDSKIGTQMGTGEKKPALSELRMRRILACDDIEELYTLIRRALAILDGQVNLADLSFTLWNWEQLAEKRPYDSRKQLAYDYYAVAAL